VRAIYVSEWGGLIPPHKARELYDAGIRHITVQTYGSGPQGVRANPYAESVFTNCLEAGMTIAAVVWPSWNWPEGLVACGQHASRLQFLALDVEARAPVHQDQIRDITNRGIRPAIYTSMSQWAAIMGDRDDFNGVLLYDASWFNDLGPSNWPPDIMSRFTSYGGWTRRHIWQFTGGTDFHGVHCTLDLIDPSIINRISEPPPPNGNQDRIDQLDARLNEQDQLIESVLERLNRAEHALTDLRNTLLNHYPLNFDM